MLKLDKKDNACSTYEQSNIVCNKCVRNIGFYSMEHKKWGKYEIVAGHCSGFIDNKMKVPPKKAINWL
jgi:hypothetical protein